MARVVAAQVAPWIGHTGLEVVFRAAGGGWTESRCPVAAVLRQPSGGVTMRMAQPCWQWLTARLRTTNDANCSGVGGGQPGPYGAATFVENVPGVLGQAQPGCAGFWCSTQPGDGLLQRDGRLLYLPREGEALATTPRAVLAVSEGLIVAENISELLITGLTFEYSTWRAPSLGADGRSGGFVEVQAGAHYTHPSPDGSWCGDCLGRGPAALLLRGARRSVISGCAVQHVGADGVAMLGGAQGNNISRTSFNDISGSAVAIGSIESCPPTERGPCYIAPDLQDSGNSVTDCSTVDTGAEYRGSAAIFVAVARETTLSHNDIGDTPWSAIAFGWGWSLQPATWAGRNSVTRNNLHGMMRLLGDGGAVYTLGPQGGQPCLSGGPDAPFPRNSSAEPPSLIAFNYIHDAGNHATALLDHGGVQEGTHSPGGVYTDQGR